jgi:hypothetical protein
MAPAAQPAEWTMQPARCERVYGLISFREPGSTASAGSSNITWATPATVACTPGVRAQPTFFAETMTASYTTSASSTQPARSRDCLRMRIDKRDDKSVIRMESQSCQITMESMKRKWMHDSTLEFTAGEGVIQIRGKDFLAAAECVECLEQDGKLILTGRVMLTSQKGHGPMTVMNAQKLIWNCATGECQAEGAASITTR